MEPKKVDEEVSAAARALGSKGGKARAAALTTEERRKIALKGAKKRWKGHRPKRQAKRKSHGEAGE